MVMDCLPYWCYMKMPQDLSGDTIIFTFSFFIVLCSLLKVLDSCTVQEISMVNGSTSEALQTYV